MCAQEAKHDGVDIRDPDTDGMACTGNVIKLHFFAAFPHFFVEDHALTEGDNGIFIAMDDQQRRNVAIR